MAGVCALPTGMCATVVPEPGAGAGVAVGVGLRVTVNAGAGTSAGVATGAALPTREEAVAMRVW